MQHGKRGQLVRAQYTAPRAPCGPDTCPSVRSPVSPPCLYHLFPSQVLGLSNYSHWSGAATLRQCAQSDPRTASELLGFARKRLERFAHVGITDMIDLSVESCAASLDMDMDGPAYTDEEVRVSALFLVTRNMTQRWPA